MNNKTLGIVINTLDYKDNDAIITVMSKEYGKISLYAKGYKKLTSKNSSSAQLFDQSEFLFDYNETKSTQILKSASIRNEFLKIKADYDKIVIACLMAEICNAVNEDLYEFLLESLQLLNDSDQSFLILNLFVVHISNLLGVNPYVDGCALCDDVNNIETISIEDGGFICHNCNQHLHKEKLDVELLRKFRVTNKANYQVIDKLVGYNDKRITRLLMDIFIKYSGINLKSYKSLEKTL